MNEWNVEYDVSRTFINGDVPFLKEISKYMLFSFTGKEGTLLLIISNVMETFQYSSRNSPEALSHFMIIK